MSVITENKCVLCHWRTAKHALTDDGKVFYSYCEFHGVQTFPSNTCPDFKAIDVSKMRTELKELGDRVSGLYENID